MFPYQLISLVVYLCLSAGAIFHSLLLRKKVGDIWFDGQGKKQSLLTTVVFILGGIYLITGSGLIKYALFLIAFVVHYFVTRFYVGTNGIKSGTHFYTYDQIKEYRQYIETNELSIYLNGKPEEIYLRPRIAYRSSIIRQFLDREGIPNQSEDTSLD